MHFTKKSRDVTRALDAAASKYDGKLTPELVIKEAKVKSSPLHDEFVWDNNRAGHLYRLVQARRILRVYSVQKISGSDKTMTARKFYRVQVVEGERKQYVRATEVFKDEDLTRKAAVEAFNQFRQHIKILEPFPKYFSGLLEAINEACAKVNLGEQRGMAAS